MHERDAIKQTIKEDVNDIWKIILIGPLLNSRRSQMGRICWLENVRKKRIVKPPARLMDL